MEFHNSIFIWLPIIAGAEGRANSDLAGCLVQDRGKPNTRGSSGVVKPWCTADLFVSYPVVPENNRWIARKLHARSSVIDKIAVKTGVGKTVFSQFRAQPGTRV